LFLGNLGFVSIPSSLWITSNVILVLGVKFCKISISSVNWIILFVVYETVVTKAVCTILNQINQSSQLYCRYSPQSDQCTDKLAPRLNLAIKMKLYDTRWKDWRQLSVTHVSQVCINFLVCSGTEVATQLVIARETCNNSPSQSKPFSRYPKMISINVLYVLRPTRVVRYT
jgi:hypothetical protein